MVLGLLGVSIVARRLRVAEMAPLAKVCLACLAAYTVLSFASIAWAAAPADAFEGANRTLFYLLVFVLFTTSPQQPREAAILLAGWTLAMVGLAAYVALRLDGATAAGLHELLPGGRLVFPSGYANANAAQFLMAFWPAVLLARSRHLPSALRGLLAGGAVLLAGVALLSQSRGSLLATGVMLILILLIFGERTRTFALLATVAVGIGLGAPAVLAVGDHLTRGEVSPAYLPPAIVAMFTAAASVGLLVALGAVVETSRVLSDRSARRVRRGLGAVAFTTLIAIVVGGLVVAGNPVTRIRHSWESFKSGYPSHHTSGSRLLSGLGSSRYDFYRVALDEFAAHPLFGIGVDNFQQQYLEHRHGDETPRYPHSIEIMTLAETGLIGASLAFTGLFAGFLAGARAARSASAADPLAGVTAAAALGGFAYWLIHGSADWFWEIAGLGAPAFALLGVACAMARPARHTPGTEPPWLSDRLAPLSRATSHLRLPSSRRLAITGCVTLAVASAVSLIALWTR
jgi:O-Antigen ligase